jgi:uncharacterized membrane protein
MTIEKKRILSIDILRGLVMVIMALDHTRDFFHNGVLNGDPLNADTTNIFLFFTRWITHFCAPTFVFLSGISAYLSAKNKNPNEASLFLIKRGIWLIFVEVVLITFGLTFNPFYNIIILQVIWAIGCSMILLGIFSRISYKLILIIGLILVLGHNLSNYPGLLPLPDIKTSLGKIIGALFSSSVQFIPIGKAQNHVIGIFYTVLPWTGVMMIGYAVGRWYEASFDTIRRKKLLFYTGLGLFLSFLILRYFSWYGNPQPRKEYTETLKVIFDFLNVSKYPPSLQYLGMTLGPALMILSGIENLTNRFAKIMMVYGKVPFFYYVIHFYLLHLFVVIAFFASGYGINEISSPQSPFLFQPINSGFSLPIVYLIWFSVVAILYRPCVWFQQYKATHQQWWLKYL